MNTTVELTVVPGNYQDEEQSRCEIVDLITSTCDYYLYRTDALSAWLDREDIDKDFRYEIGALIIEILEEMRDTLGYWEKLNIARSIDALGWNTYAITQPTNSWLRLCLISLRRAIAPRDDSKEEFTRRADDIDEFSCEQLLIRMRELQMLN